jgi:hypothetical protein
LIPSGFIFFCLGPGGEPEKYHVNISTKEIKSIQLYLTSIFPGIFLKKRSIHSTIGAGWRESKKETRRNFFSERRNSSLMLTSRPC